MVRRRKTRPVVDERLLTILLAVVLALVGIARLSARLTPFVVAAAQAQFLNELTADLTDAAESGAKTQGELFAAARGAAERLQRLDASVPVGSLLGFAPLSGRGPAVHLRLPAAAELRVIVTETTCRVTAELTLFLPWTCERTTTSTEIHFT